MSRIDNTNKSEIKKCKYESKEEKTNAIIETLAQLFSSYYEKFTETFNKQYLEFINNWQTNNDPYYFNYLFKRVIKIHRQRLDDELNKKFNDLVNIVLNDKKYKNVNLEEDLNLDFYSSFFQQQLTTLNNSIDRILVDVQTYLNRMVDNINKNKNQQDTAYLTNFLSDTELDAREINEKRKKKKLNKSNSESELDNFLVIKKSASEEAINSHLLKSFTFDKTKSKTDKYSSKSYLKLGMSVFAAKDDTYYHWEKARIVEIIANRSHSDVSSQRVLVKFNGDEKSELPISSIAFSEPIGENYVLPIRSRVVAMNRNENDKKAPFYSVGTVCELPNPHNQNRYLIFFDDGYAQYIKKKEAYPVADRFKVSHELNKSHLEFLRKYFEKYPEKAMVRLSKDHVLKVFFNGKWILARVAEVDCSLVRLVFSNTNHCEWLYRGSYRLEPFYEKHLQTGVKNLNRSALTRHQFGSNIEASSSSDDSIRPIRFISNYASTLFPSVKQQTARKSSALSSSSSGGSVSTQLTNGSIDVINPILQNNINTQNGVSRVQQGQIRHLDLIGIIREEVIHFTPHSCTNQCVLKWEININKSKPYNLLLVPTFCGWQRHIYSLSKDSNKKNRKNVYYVAPCGRNLRNINEIDHYLYMTNSNLTIDMFSMDVYIHIDREFEANSRYLNIKDIADGKDDAPISCVNCIDFTKPEQFEYSNHRVPLQGVPLNNDVGLLDGCDCEDGCRDPLKCACWRKTFEASTFAGELNTNVGYCGRRLLEMVNTGIFECNPNCKCDKRCSNRVVQNGISVRLQLFKASAKKGWGLRCLDDIAKGAFICIYTGHVMTEEQSDVQGKDLGDEYFAELDFVECLKRLRKDKSNSDESDDDDAIISYYNNIQSKTSEKTTTTTTTVSAATTNKNENIIEYIYLNDSDEEESKGHSSSSNSISTLNNNNNVQKKRQRNPSINNNRNISALEIIYSNRFFRSPRNRFYFKDYLKQNDIFIMDAKLCGNIGRYFNHSCSPNIFVQNVFIDTYDFRFPWIAFFASQYIRAGTELCWDYNYQPNSVEGRELYCQCGSNLCRGRLL